MVFGHPPNSNQLAEMAYPTGFQSPFSATASAPVFSVAPMPQPVVGMPNMHPAIGVMPHMQPERVMDSYSQMVMGAPQPRRLPNERSADARYDFRQPNVPLLEDDFSPRRSHEPTRSQEPRGIHRERNLGTLDLRGDFESHPELGMSREGFERRSSTPLSYLWKLADSNAPVVDVNRKIRDAYRSGDITSADAKALLSELGVRAKSYSEFGEEDLATVPSRYYAGSPNLAQSRKERLEDEAWSEKYDYDKLLDEFIGGGIMAGGASSEAARDLQSVASIFGEDIALGADVPAGSKAVAFGPDKTTDSWNSVYRESIKKGLSEDAAVSAADNALIALLDGPEQTMAGGPSVSQTPISTEIAQLDEAQTTKLAEKVKNAKGLTTGEQALLVGTIGLMPALAALTSLLVKGKGRKKGERYYKTRGGKRIYTG